MPKASPMEREDNKFMNIRLVDQYVKDYIAPHELAAMETQVAAAH